MGINYIPISTFFFCRISGCHQHHQQFLVGYVEIRCQIFFNVFAGKKIWNIFFLFIMGPTVGPTASHKGSKGSFFHGLPWWFWVRKGTFQSLSITIDIVEFDFPPPKSPMKHDGFEGGVLRFDTAPMFRLYLWGFYMLPSLKLTQHLQIGRASLRNHSYSNHAFSRQKLWVSDSFRVYTTEIQLIVTFSKPYF